MSNYLFPRLLYGSDKFLDFQKEIEMSKVIHFPYSSHNSVLRKLFGGVIFLLNVQKLVRNHLAATRLND